MSEPFDALDKGVLGIIEVYEEAARSLDPAPDLAAIRDRLLDASPQDFALPKLNRAGGE